MKVSLQDGERNVQKQTSQMEAFISQGANLLVLQATDAAGLAPVVRKAEQAGIPVITLNQDVAGVKTGFVGMGHYTMGVQVAQGMAAQLNKKGKIVVIEGTQGAGANIQRMAGFNEEIKKYPEFAIVAKQSAAFDRKKAYDVFRTILQGQPQIDAVFGVSDEMALGAAQAATDANRRTGIRFWGADGGLPMFKAIKSGLCDGTSAITGYAVPDTVMTLACFLLTAGVKGGVLAGRVELPPTSLPVLISIWCRGRARRRVPSRGHERRILPRPGQFPGRDLRLAGAASLDRPLADERARRRRSHARPGLLLVRAGLRD